MFYLSPLRGQEYNRVNEGSIRFNLGREASLPRFQISPELSDHEMER